MGKYIHFYENESDFNADYYTENYLEPWVSLTEDIERVNYNKVDYSKIPLTFEILSDGNIGLVVTDENAPKTKVLYSINNGDWTELIPANNTTFPVVNGDVVQFKGDNPTYGSYVSYVGHYTYFNSTCNYRIKGNIMSLIDSTNFASLKALQSGYTFYSLFSDCTGLTDASELLLPATTLTYRCYYYMFKNCTNLTQAPELPATILAEDCYLGMFNSCTSLTTAPALPSTTLAEGCYAGMFYGCTSLTTAPALPATTLAQECYFHMFYNCTSLITAPELPATTLTYMCYSGMFYGCRNLNYIKCLATNISASNCTTDWVYGVQTNSGTFVKTASTDWSSKTGTNGIPTNWTVQDAS